MSDEIRLALKPGTEIDGYRIESVLGAGGFGITYRATEIVLGRTVAIKEFLPSGIATREEQTLAVTPLTPSAAADIAWGMDRFRAEAQTLVAFQHPNIVGVHRYFEANGTGYLVMAFVEGRTLSELLFPDKTLDESEIHEIIDPLLDGLQAVHDRGFLHRDIKPANIFIREDGTPILIDFGAARQALGQQSKSLTAIISEGYAPYEQYDQSGDQGPWTDIYALGGVLYRCVTGQRPPDAPSRITAMVRGRPDPMPPVREAVRGAYSDALLNAIDRAQATREDDRPQTISEFRALLSGQADALATAPTGADETRVAGPDAPPPAPAQPSPASGASTGRKLDWRIPAAAVLLLGGGVGAWALVSGGESEACSNHRTAAASALDRRDPATALAAITAGESAGCDKGVLAEQRSRLTRLRTDLAAAAARKAAEDRRRKAAEAARKAAEEKRKKEAEAERKAAEEKRKEEAAAQRRTAAIKAFADRCSATARKGVSAMMEKDTPAETRRKLVELAVSGCGCIARGVNDSQSIPGADKKIILGAKAMRTSYPNMSRAGVKAYRALRNLCIKPMEAVWAAEMSRRKRAKALERHKTNIEPFVASCRASFAKHLIPQFRKDFVAKDSEKIVKAMNASCRCVAEKAAASTKVREETKYNLWVAGKILLDTNGHKDPALTKIVDDCEAPIRRLIKAAKPKRAGAGPSISIGELHRKAGLKARAAKDYAAAKRHFENGIAAGDVESLVQLGRLYQNGDGVPKNGSRALELYRQAHARGSAAAMRYIGLSYEYGDGVKKDLAESVRWYEKAAARGYTKAMHDLGLAYYGAIGVKRDYKTAFQWFQKAASRGHVEAMAYVGQCYDKGHGVKRDRTKAAAWFKRAADRGHAHSMTNLGLMYQSGEGVKRDPALAFRLIYKAAQSGGAIPAEVLGDAYYFGRGTKRNFKEAARWYKRSADKGSSASRQ